MNHSSLFRIVGSRQQHFIAPLYGQHVVFEESEECIEHAIVANKIFGQFVIGDLHGSFELDQQAVQHVGDFGVVFEQRRVKYNVQIRKEWFDVFDDSRCECGLQFWDLQISKGVDHGDFHCF